MTEKHSAGNGVRRKRSWSQKRVCRGRSSTDHRDDLVVVGAVFISGKAGGKGNMKKEKEYVWEFKGKLIHLYERDIYYIHLEERNIYVHTHNRTYPIGKCMQEEEEYLKEMPVLRTHYSYLIHMKYLEALTSTEAILRNGDRVPVSASRKKQVLEAVRAYFYETKKCRKTGQNGMETV